jgi:hypothetical protein
MAELILLYYKPESTSKIGTVLAIYKLIGILWHSLLKFNNFCRGLNFFCVIFCVITEKFVRSIVPVLSKLGYPFGN